jgi:FixJ family two-component response regulator
MKEGKSMIYLIDDDGPVRRSLETLMASVGLVAQSFASAREFLEAPQSDVASCLVLDVRLPDVNGLELQRELASREIHTPIVFITAHGDIPMTVQAMKAGAIEFLTKPVRGQELLEAVRRGVARDCELRKERAELAELRQRFAALTPRESDVLKLLTAGLLNKQIAQRLGTSELTVKTHRAHLMAKTRAESAAHLACMFEKLTAATRHDGRASIVRDGFEIGERSPYKAG